MTFMFENLRVYRNAVDVAERVSKITDHFPRGSYYLTDQVNRAALSISINLAEGNDHYTKADRKNFFIIARGSVHGCIPVLEVCRRRELITDETAKALKEYLDKIAKMIAGLISGLDNRETP